MMNAQSGDTTDRYPVVKTLEDFKNNFSIFTANMFKGLDWSNILVAGGSVLGCLQRYLFLTQRTRYVRFTRPNYVHCV